MIINTEENKISETFSFTISCDMLVVFNCRKIHLNELHSIITLSPQLKPNQYEIAYKIRTTKYIIHVCLRFFKVPRINFRLETGDRQACVFLKHLLRIDNNNEEIIIFEN